MSIARYSNRLIGFFDVLGFSARLLTMHLEELHTLYATLIDEVDQTVFQQKVQVASAVGSQIERPADNFAKSQFISDSLILVSHPVEDITNVSNFILGCTRLMEACFVAQLPLRGAIGVGDLLDDIGRGISLSAVFPELVRTEKDQNWTGCHLLPNSEDLVIEALFGTPYLKSSREPQARFPLLPYAVPFKGQNGLHYESRWCLNWPYLLDKRQLQIGLSYLRGSKHDQTERFIDFVFGLPDQSQPLTEELAPAHSVRHLGTRSGMTFRLFDKNGFHEPLDGRPISFFIVGEQ